MITDNNGYVHNDYVNVLRTLSNAAFDVPPVQIRLCCNGYVHYSLFIIHYSLFIIHCSLFIDWWLFMRRRKKKLGFKKFYLLRFVDVHSISGVGRVAEGIQFTNGEVVLCWLSSPHSISVYKSVDAVLKIHGHGGNTTVEWFD